MINMVMTKRLDWVWIQEQYDTGLSYADLLRLYRISSRAFQLARERGVFTPRPKLEALRAAKRVKLSNQYDWSAIQKFHSGGGSWRDIQNHFGVTQSAIAAAVKRGVFVSRDRKEAHQLRLKNGWRPSPMCDEARAAASERQSLRNSGGRCKWFEVDGQKVQGTWERDAGLKLTELGVEWRKCGGKSDILMYTIDGKQKRYTPDFYLPNHNVFLEFKGYWWGDDRRKMDAVIAQHPGVSIVILETKEYNSLLCGDITWLT